MNIGKFGGGGGLTDEGRCRGGAFKGLLSLSPCRKNAHLNSQKIKNNMQVSHLLSLISKHNSVFLRYKYNSELNYMDVRMKFRDLL